MTALPTLFKRDTRGNIRQWVIEPIGSTIVIQHGITGKAQVEQVTPCKAKNVGKRNATTAQEQAVAEAGSRWRKQIDREDYHEDITQAGLQFRPMLAQDYLKVPHQVEWSQVVAQPKLDGLRLNYGKRSESRPEHVFLSRKGESYQLDHLAEGSEALLYWINNNEVKCQALDGEAYNHHWPLQKILSNARRVQQDTQQLDYYLFDLAIPEMEFRDRHKILHAALEVIAPSYPQLKLVRNHACPDEAQATRLQTTFMRHGFEGVMLRHADSPYAIGQRSSDLFKYKKFMDAECLIMAVYADKNRNAMLRCMHPETGQEFDCTPKRPHAERKRMLKADLAGKWITVKYQGLTPDGIPQFPVGLDLRECTESGEPIA